MYNFIIHVIFQRQLWQYYIILYYGGEIVFYFNFDYKKALLRLI